MKSKKIRLVLLPGMDGTGLLFSAFIASLPPEVEAQVISYRDDETAYSSLLLRLEQELPSGDPFVLVAESFSTPLAVRFAATHPDGCQALVLVAGFVTSPVGRSWKSLLAIGSRFLFHVPLTAGIVRYWLLSHESSDVLVEQVRDVLKHLPPATMQARLRSILNVDATGALKRVTVPVLYLQAEKDTLVSEKNLRKIQRIKPEIVVRRLDAPHLVLQAAPEDGRDVILLFCSDLSRQDKHFSD